MPKQQDRLRPECCPDWRCRIAYDERQRLEHRRRQRERQLQEAARQRAQAALALNIISPETYEPAVVPVNFHVIGNLPEKRRRAFRDHLNHVISAAAESRGEAATALAANLELTEEAQAAFGGACATCRGQCCTGGGTHAYLDVATIHAYMRQHPEKRPRDVLVDYLSYLPNKSYRESCVYHTETGCGLPREMRAQVSRDYICESLVTLRDRLARGPLSHVFFAAMEDEFVVRSQFVEIPTADAIPKETQSTP